MFKMFYFTKRFLILALTLMAVVGIIGVTSKNHFLPTLLADNPLKSVVIIDAGHGGIDGGAVASDGTYEKDINLNISVKTALLFKFFGKNTVLTRSEDISLDASESNSIRQNKIADIKKRESIANSYSDAIFLSIHLNKFEQTQYKGAQVFYSENNEDSQTLALSLQENLRLGLDMSNNRVAKPASDDIYLMKNLDIPAVIIECGFLSNYEELQNLKDNDYHKKIAISILSGSIDFT